MQGAADGKWYSEGANRQNTFEPTQSAIDERGEAVAVERGELHDSAEPEAETELQAAAEPVHKSIADIQPVDERVSPDQQVDESA